MSASQGSQGTRMPGLDWDRPLEEVLGEDATARRQLAEHAQLLPIAGPGASMRFMLARLREHWLSATATLLITVGGAVAAAVESVPVPLA